MKMTVAILGVSLALYIIAPIIVGIAGIGERRGPKVFIQSHHETLYIIGYEITHDDKARQNIVYDRPWFYGLKPRKKDRDEIPLFRNNPNNTEIQRMYDEY